MRPEQFELIDIESGNVVGLFDTAEAALVSVRATLREHGRHAAVTLGLSSVDDDSDGAVIAVGTALIALATRPAAAHAD